MQKLAPGFSSHLVSGQMPWFFKVILLSGSLSLQQRSKCQPVTPLLISSFAHQESEWSKESLNADPINTSGNFGQGYICWMFGEHRETTLVATSLAAQESQLMELSRSPRTKPTANSETFSICLTAVYIYILKNAVFPGLNFSAQNDVRTGLQWEEF